MQSRCKRDWTALLCIVMAVVCLNGIPHDAHADVLETIQDAFRRWELFQGVQVTGHNQLTFQKHTIDGSESAFQGQYWDTDDIQRQSSLHVEGPIWKEFGFQADFSYSGYDEDHTRWIAGYSGHDTSLFYGDLNINLAGNEFVSFSKTLTGYQLDQRLPNDGLLRAFRSKNKGVTRNQTIQGNNTAGPYFLTYTPIIDGSEVVKVGEEVQEFGEDYRLDYQSGQLWFEVGDNPPKIIPDTQVISVSYQSAGYGADVGTLTGYRAEMPLLNNRLLVGFTRVEQDRPDIQSDTVGYQEDVYQGSGSTGPFDTTYRPIISNGTTVTYKGERKTIDQALVVLVDNVEQAEGVDYDSYRNIGRIIFRRAVPPTSLVVVRYYYDLTTNYQSADTEVTGFDLNYRINDNLSLRGDFGESNDGNTTGNASQINLNYDRPGLRTLISYRDIDPDFSYINSSGFYQQEKGTDIGINWDPMDHVRIYSRFSEMERTQGYSTGYGSFGGSYDGSYDGSYGGGYYDDYGGYGSGYNTFAAGTAQTDNTTGSSGFSVNTDRQEFDIDLDFPGWPDLTLSRQKYANDSAGSTSEDTNNSLRWRWAPSEASYSLSGSFANSRQNYITADSDSDRDSETKQWDVRGTYDPMDDLSLTASLSQNDSSSSASDSPSSSENMQLDVRWSPLDNLNVSLNHRISESVGSTTGYSSSGSYYGGIGGGGGSYIPPDQDDDTREDETDRYEDTTSQFNISYRPTDRISLDFMNSRRKYTSGGSVGYLADSEQDTRNLSLTWRASDIWTFNTMWGTDEMDFLQEGRGKISNEMFTLGTNYQPEDKPYSVGLNLNMQSGSSPTYVGFGEAQKMFMVDNDLFDIQSYINWELNDKSSISMQLGKSDFTGGYSDFTKDMCQIQYNHNISNLLTLSAGYRYIRNTSDLPQDPRLGYTGLTPPSQNYVAETFLVTVSTNFHSGAGGRRQRYTGYGGSTGFGLGSFGGYRASSPFGSSYEGYGYDSGYTGGSSYGPGYGAFDNLRRSGEQYSQDRLPGYGIFEGGRDDSRDYSEPHGGPQEGLETGLGEFEAQERAPEIDRPQDGVQLPEDFAPERRPRPPRAPGAPPGEGYIPDIDTPFDPTDPSYEPGTSLLF